jgi:hypothetical protein
MFVERTIISIVNNNMGLEITNNIPMNKIRMKIELLYGHSILYQSELIFSFVFY